MAQAIDPAHLELILKTMGIENVKEVTAAYEELAKSAKGSVQPLDEAKTALASIEEAAAPAKVALEEVAGKGEGESGTGGFAGAAAGALKFERAASGLATGHGIRGATTALEGLIGMLGGPAGIGLAIGATIQAIDILLPKFEKWIETLNGEADAIKRVTEALKEQEKIREEVQKAIEAPTQQQAAQAKAVTDLLGEGRGAAVRAGISRGLTTQGFGLFAPQQEFIRKVEAGELPQTPENLARVMELRQQQNEAVQAQADVMYQALPTNETVRQSVMGMGQVPEEFRTRLAQTTPAAMKAAKEQAQKAQDVSAWAEETYKQREAAKAENIDIQVQFDKARRDKRDQDAAQRERDDTVEEQGKEADERHVKQERSIAERARLKDEHERKKASTPLAQMTRGVQQMAPGLEQQGFDVEGIAREALRQLPATGNNAAVAIQQAILAAYQRGLRMQQEDMARMQMFTEMMQGSR